MCGPLICPPFIFFVKAIHHKGMRNYDKILVRNLDFWSDIFAKMCCWSRDSNTLRVEQSMQQSSMKQMTRNKILKDWIT